MKTNRMVEKRCNGVVVARVPVSKGRGLLIDLLLKPACKSVDRIADARCRDGYCQARLVAMEDDAIRNMLDKIASEKIKE